MSKGFYFGIGVIVGVFTLTLFNAIQFLHDDKGANEENATFRDNYSSYLTSSYSEPKRPYNLSVIECITGIIHINDSSIYCEFPLSEEEQVKG